jgi:HSP20 family protein
MTEKNTTEKSRIQKARGNTSLAIPGFSAPSIFEDFMKPFNESLASLFSNSTSPLWTEFAKGSNADVQDRGDHFSVTAQLPGFDKKDVDVHVGSNSVELKAEKRSETKSKKSDSNSSTYSYFHRYFTLPEHVLPQKVDWTMKNGILELKLPKSERKPKESSHRVRLN